MQQCTNAQVLNEVHSEGLRQALSRPKSIVDDAAFISIDRQGADVRVRRSNDYVVERMTFSTVRCWHGLRRTQQIVSCANLSRVPFL